MKLSELLEELNLLYSGFCKGLTAEECHALLPAINQQYIDYIRWKLQMLASPEGEAHLAYLRRLLAGELPVLNLPTDRPRPPVQTYNTASHFLTMSSELTQQIKATIQAERTALYPFLVAAFFVLLHRYTGQEDILLGAPHSERGHHKFKGIVGYFDNPVPLRVDLSGNPTFRTFLRTIHQMIWEAFDHEDYPSHLLINQLHLHRDASHPPLFQTIFQFQEHQQRKDKCLPKINYIFCSVGNDDFFNIFHVVFPSFVGIKFDPRILHKAPQDFKDVYLWRVRR